MSGDPANACSGVLAGWFQNSKIHVHFTVVKKPDYTLDIKLIKSHLQYCTPMRAIRKHRPFPAAQEYSTVALYCRLTGKVVSLFP